MLFLAGYAANAAIGKGAPSPGMQILTKPFSLNALAAKINTMVGRAVRSIIVDGGQGGDG